MIGIFILLSVGLVAAKSIVKQQPVYVTGQQHYQQAPPDLTYGPPEQIGTYPQPGPTWQWPQKQIYQKPVTVYQPLVYIPVIKPFPTYKPVPINKPTFKEKIEGIKSDIADKIADKIAGVKAFGSVIKSEIGSKVSGIKSHVADGITDKIVGLKVIGAHIGEEVKEIGTAVGSALYNKKHYKPHYVLEPKPQGPTYTYDPPSLTYGAPESTYKVPDLTYGAPEPTYRAPEHTYRAPEIVFK